jgi:hypothetical protein
MDTMSKTIIIHVLTTQPDIEFSNASKKLKKKKNNKKTTTKKTNK